MVRLLTPTRSPYLLRLGAGPQDIQRAQRLRYEVFNLELGEGLEDSHFTGLDADPYDEVCDHLLLEQEETGELVGTYRLQTGARAASRRGYYSAQEFEFTPLEPIRAELVELGRACVRQDHRNLVALGLLWKGIGSYALARGARYLCGCSSLTSQDPSEGAAAYAALSAHHLAPPELRTVPTETFRCPMNAPAPVPPKIPKLLRAYLALGAWICGPPAIDRAFRTIDFLTLLDLEALAPADRERFLR